MKGEHPVSADPLLREANKAVLRRLSVSVSDEKRLDRADEIVAEDYMDHGALPG